MKKRVLFVDDEPLVLQGLQRMLRPMRTDWDMEYTDSGAAALLRMDQTPFDVVVSDMMMPGMNGAELLNQVMTRFPLTVRLILSGHADQDLVMKCVGTTHQYLSKPCDPEHLKTAVQRASAVGSTLQNDSVKKLVGQMEHLPSLPSLYVDVVEKLQDPEIQIEEISRIIARDIGMTAKILKLVNSAFFGLPQHISNLDDAVAYLGLNTIKTLVLCLNAFSQYDGLKVPGFSMEALWRHSLETASLAKRICLMETADRHQVEEAFVAGMLHDAGQIVLASNFPQDYERVLEVARNTPLPLAAAETQVLGAHHATVGGYLLGLWGLPVPVVEAIALHHQPADSSIHSFSVLIAVHVANRLVQEPSGWLNGIPSSPLAADYVAALGLGARVEAWRHAPTEEELNQGMV